MKWARFGFFGELFVVLFLYLLGAWLGLRISIITGLASVIWPPTGLAIAVMLIRGYHIWPAITLGAALINWSQGASEGAAIAIGFGNTVEALAATYFLSKFNFPQNLKSPRYLPVYFVIVLLSCLVSSTVGNLSLFLAGNLSEDLVPHTWLVWTLTNIMGAFVLTPLIFSFFDIDHKPIRFQPIKLSKVRAEKYIEAVALAVTILILSGIVFLDWIPVLTEYPKTSFLFVVLIWAASRFELIGSSVVVFIIMVIAVAASALGYGPFDGKDLVQGLLHLQVFIASLSVMGLFLSGFVAEMRAAQDKLEIQNVSLEQTVANRTRELEKALIKAEEASRAKTSFLTNMSHEIRTPLGIILGFSELIVDPKQSESARREYAETIRLNGVQLFDLISNILDLSKIESGHLQIEKFEINTEEFLEEIRKLMEPKAKLKGLDLTFSKRGSVPEKIVTDPMRLRQIFVNLIGNALKFTTKGKIEIRMLFVTSKNKKLLAFDIADTGIGLSPNERQILFRPFVQADSSMTRKFGGTGLGLDLSKRFAQKLGGDLVLAASKSGRGSVFRVTLDPGDYRSRYLRPRKVLSSRHAEIPSAKTLENRKILLVDDSVDNRELVTRFLNGAGGSVDLASNGEEGWKMALSGNYDVVLMDIQMPVMDGFESTRHLREEGYSRPIIALTAHGLSEERDRCLSSGFSGYLSKPVSRAVLIDQISKMIEDVSPDET